MKKLVLLFLFGINFSVFSQVIQLEIDTFSRSIPTANFGGQTWRGPSWVNSAFNDSVATMYPDILAFPPSPDIWDWENGWFYSQSVLDTCCVDTIFLNWGQLNAPVIDITTVNFQTALNQIDAEGLYCLNMISSSISKQLSDLHYAKDNGVFLERIRLGDEMGKAGNELSISHYPTAEDYAATCDLYIDSIRDFLPETKIAVSAGNFGNSNPRAQYWNEALYEMNNKADAFRWSAFFYLKPSDTIFTTQQLLAYAFDQIPTYEQTRGFQDTITELQDYELWVGYNITDNTLDKRYANRWSLVLMLSASNYIFLNNRLVEDISLFNVGGIFENWDALDTQDNFRKRATGVFAEIWNKAKLNKNKASKIKVFNNIVDTVTYYNPNNVPRDVNYPTLFGWRFENDSTFEASIILTNISSQPINISIDNLLDGNVSWKKWYSDSLFAVIDSVNYINTLTDAGTSNIVLPAYSINVAVGECISDVDNDGICDELEISGCTNDIACNYNSFATDNNNCLFPGDNCIFNINEDGVILYGLYNSNCLCLENSSSIYEKAPQKKLITTISILGEETHNNSRFQLEIYDDGSIEKLYILK